MKKIIKGLLLCMGCLYSMATLRAQDYLVDYTFLGTRTKFELLILFGQPADNDINLYKIRYKTPDVHGQLDTASALLVTPVVSADTELPIVVYEHGTTSGPTDVPSQLRGGFEVAMAYAAKGFITVAPDYLGLGDARGFHPYIHAATEASASFDALNASVEWLQSNPPEWDVEHLFLAGYSQGGHASAALHKYLQDYFSLVYPVTAATHMSGPYSVSGVMRDKLLSDDSYGFPAYIAYIALGLQEAYGNLYTDLNAFFKEPYVTSISSFRNGTINLTTLNTTLVNQLKTNGDTIVKRMLQDSVLEKLVNDPTYSVNLALADNDLFNWAPEAPTRLFYCGGDKQVPPQNSIVADAAMNALGAPDTHAVSLSATFDHGPCVLPAILASLSFFKSFLTTSVVDFEKNPKAIQVMPNPATDYLTINWESAASGMEYVIFNTNGMVAASGNAASNTIDVHTLNAGMYMVVVTANHQSRTARFIHP